MLLTCVAASVDHTFSLNRFPRRSRRSNRFWRNCFSLLLVTADCGLAGWNISAATVTSCSTFSLAAILQAHRELGAPPRKGNISLLRCWKNTDGRLTFCTGQLRMRRLKRPANCTPHGWTDPPPPPELTTFPFRSHHHCSACSAHLH
ncbi:hypothetical protein GN956_G5860 [Arapaima gigas]